MHASVCCVVDKALPHTVSTDASLSSVDASTNSMPVRHKSISLDLDNLSVPPTELAAITIDSSTTRVRRSTRSSSLLLATDVQVVVAWLESFEDYLTFPVGTFAYVDRKLFVCVQHSVTRSASW